MSYPLLTFPRRLGGAWLQTFFIKRYIRKSKLQNEYDLIHALVGYPSGVIADKLSEILKIPYVITEVMGPFPFPHLRLKNRKIWPPLMQAYLNAKINIADGKVKLLNMQSEGILNSQYIPNFINEEKFSMASKPKNSKFQFFTLGGFVHGKGIDVLLKAISLLDNKEEYFFVIGGGGALAAEYKKMAKEFQIDHLIEWHQHLDRNQAVQQFHRCHSFVLPSRHESFGIVYVEALFCGRPIIATKCGGPEEYVNEENGLLCKVDDAHELANCIYKMKNNYETYNAEKIREWAFTRYSSKTVCAQIITTYEKVLNSKEN